MVKKIFFVLVFFVNFAFSANAVYVRKLKEPNFFIPESDRMHKQEILNRKVRYNNVKAKKFLIEMKNPEYKEKAVFYKKSLDEFVKTGEFIKDETLEKDMENMKEAKVFEVVEEAPKTIETKEQKNFYSLVDKVIKN